jgi:NAD(P)-dependent dehydrogenase (short-subunit alcohol dehydrogenase family)
MELEGRTAVVTGGGSGIGRALVLALASSGCNLVVADIEEDAASAVAEEALAAGAKAIAVRTDVADRASVDELADRAFAELGAVHVLCNNAGVLIMTPVLDCIVEDWEWLLGVNVMGVVHGVHAFVPRMIEQGEPGHIVNTSSVAGFGGGGIYGTSKAAIVALSESLRTELEPKDIGVSVLCPANISSRILGAQRNRPERFGRLAFEPFGRDLVDYGLDPKHVADRTVDAIRANELYVFAFPDGWEQRLKPSSEERFAKILDAIDKGGITE